MSHQFVSFFEELDQSITPADATAHGTYLSSNGPSFYMGQSKLLSQRFVEHSTSSQSATRALQPLAKAVPHNLIENQDSSL
eukprot:UN00539